MNALAIGLTTILLVIAVIHAYWGNGGIWPAADEAELARTVVGDGRRRMPPAWSSFAVAVLLGAVAILPWVFLADPANRTVLAATVVVSAIFFIRGSAGYSPRWRARFSAEPFATWDQRLYSPLCMAIGTGFMALLAREL